MDALSVLANVDLNARIRGKYGYMSSEDAIRLDLVIEKGSGPDLGLTGFSGVVFRANRNEKFLLKTIDNSILTNVEVIMEHFKDPECRCEALSRGGHFEKVSTDDIHKWFLDMHGQPEKWTYRMTELLVESGATKKLDALCFVDIMSHSNYVMCLEGPNDHWYCPEYEHLFENSTDYDMFVPCRIDYGCLPYPKQWIINNLSQEALYLALEHGDYLTGTETLSELSELAGQTSIYDIIVWQDRKLEFRVDDIISVMKRSPDQREALQMAILYEGFAANMDIEDLADYLDSTECGIDHDDLEKVIEEQCLHRDWDRETLERYISAIAVDRIMEEREIYYKDAIV